MAGKRRQKIRGVQQISLRRKLVTAAGISFSIFMACAFTVFQLAGTRPGYAYQKAIFDHADAVQVEGAVLRGTRNRPVLHIPVKVSGEGTGLDLRTISFTAGGTTMPLQAQIRNARLWYTGTINEFQTGRLCGATLPVVPAGNFEITCNLRLAAGLHHFWLTFDIPASAKPLAAIDAECNYVQVGMDKFLPFMHSPPGAREVLDNVPLYSTGSSKPGRETQWNTMRDGSGTMVTNLDSTRHTLFIQPGHKVECTAPVSVHSVCIEREGMLRIEAVLSASRLVIEEKGVLRHDDGDGREIDMLVMHGGSSLMHNHHGVMAGRRHQMSGSAEVVFYRLHESSVNGPVIWGSVLVFDTRMHAVDISRMFNQVRGDFEVRRTGMDGYLYCGRNADMHIGGNLEITGGVFRGADDAQLKLRVDGSLVVRDGYFSDAVHAGAGRTVMQLSGHAILEGGQFHFDKGKSGHSSLQLVPSGIMHDVSVWRQGSCDTRLGDLHIPENKEVQIEKGWLGKVSEGYTVTIASGGTLMCGRYPVAGPGGFVLEDRATLGIGNIHGINSESDQGNILTGHRRFSSGATYIFSSASSPQVAGEFRTRPEPHTVRSVVVNKESAEQVVVLPAALRIKGDPVVRMGIVRRAAPVSKNVN